MFFVLYLDLTAGLRRAVFPVYLVSPIGLPAYYYVYHCFIELFKILKFRQPYSLFELFKLLSPQIRSTRFNNTSIYTPNNASKSSNIFTYRSAKIWNNYRTKLDIIDFDISVDVIKNKLKCMLLSIQCAGIKTEWNDYEQNACGH